MDSTDPQTQIFLRNLRCEVPIGQDAFGFQKKPLPVVINLKLRRDFSRAEEDNIGNTLSYSVICKQTLALAHKPEHIPGNTFWDDGDYHRELHIEAAHEHGWGHSRLHLETTLPKSILQSDGGYTLRTESVQGRHGLQVTFKSYSVQDLKVACIIGVNEHERSVKQIVHINFSYYTLFPHPRIVAALVVNTVQGSSFETLEALVHNVSQELKRNLLQCFTLSIEKPTAIATVEGSGVEVTYPPSEGHDDLFSFTYLTLDAKQ